MTDYYIDPASGSNGNSGTSLDRAWRDLSPCDDDGSVSLSAGDTVHIRGEDAVGAAITSPATFAYDAGSSGNPITIEGYQGEQAVIDGQGSNGPLYLYETDYMHFKNITFRNSGDDGNGVTMDGASGSCDNNLFEDCIAHHNNVFGFYMKGDRGCRNNTFRRCLAYDQQNPGDGDGFGSSFTSSWGNTFEYCEAYHNADDGYDFFNTHPSSDGEGQTLIGCIAGFNGITSDTGNTGNGNGFKLGANLDDTGGHRLERCVTFKNTKSGFNTNSADTPVTLVNCTAWDDNAGFKTTSVSREANHRLRNNLAHECDNATSFATSVDDESNSWNMNLGDPQFVSTETNGEDRPSNPETFLHLSADSPAIGAGTSVALVGSYDESNLDLGAFQFEGSAPPDPDPEPEPDQASLKYFDGGSWNTVETTVLFKSS